MDRIIEWFGLVPEWQTISGRRVEISLRHLLWARIYPLPPLRGRVEAIAKHLGCDRKTVYRHIGYACETIAGALNKEDHIW